MIWFLATFLSMWGLSLVIRSFRAGRCRAGTRAATFHWTHGLACMVGVFLQPVSLVLFVQGTRHTDSSPNIFYPIAYAIGLFALVLIGRGLFQDAARGRIRCPKCWYDMSGHLAGGRYLCPECGHDSGSKNGLQRTRRHRASIVIGFLLLIVACLAPRAFLIPSGGAKALIPTTVMIAGIWQWPDAWTCDGAPGDRTTLSWRLRKDEQLGEADGWEWQRRWTIHRCETKMNNPSSLNDYQSARDMRVWLTADQDFVPRRGFARTAKRLASSDVTEATEAVAILTSMSAEHEHLLSQRYDSSLAAMMEGIGDTLAPALRSSDPGVVMKAAELLIEAESYQQEAADAILTRFSTYAKDTYWVTGAARVLIESQRTDAVMIQAVLSLLSDLSIETGRRAVHGAYLASLCTPVPPPILDRLEQIAAVEPESTVAFLAGKAFIESKVLDGASHNWLVAQAAGATGGVRMAAFFHVVYEPLDESTRVQSLSLIDVGLRDTNPTLVIACLDWIERLADGRDVEAALYRPAIENLLEQQSPQIRVAAQLAIDALQRQWPRPE